MSCSGRSSTSCRIRPKLRRAGFHDVIDTEAVFFRWFDDCRRAGIIP
jgi:hypothetical protein